MTFDIWFIIFSSSVTTIVSHISRYWDISTSSSFTRKVTSHTVKIGYDEVRLTSQNCGLYGPTVNPLVIAMWTMVWWYRPGLTPNLSTRGLWQPPVLSGGPVSRHISGASRRMDEGNENLVYSSPWDFKRPLTCRKILRHGTSGFTSHPKEDVLRIFIALNQTRPSPWPGLNPRPLGPVASTLITTPRRRLYIVYVSM
jgi:hypothetical protein